MKAINRKSKIKILWKVWRGVNKISEDFNSLNTHLEVFLVGGCDTYAMGHVINREVEPGYDVIEIDVYPNTLAEGAYNLKALWTKNQGRDVLTSMRSGVFGITSNVEEAEVKDEEVRLVSMVESYGRDGMSAFETAVLRGVNHGYTSEKEWADNFKTIDVVQERGASSDKVMSQKAVTDELAELDSKISSGGNGGHGSYTHHVDVKGSVWEIKHSLGGFPILTLLDETMNVFYADIEYVDTNTVKVKMSIPVKGRAICVI